MKIDVCSNPESVAREAAALITPESRAAVAARGSFVVAVSGGHTPWIMLRDLAQEELPWNAVHVVQVDERVVRRGTRTEISRIYVRACSSMRLSSPSRSIRCRWNRQIWTRPARDMP